MQIQNNMMKNDRYPEGYLPKIAYHIFKGNDEKVNYFIERQEAQYGEMGVEEMTMIGDKIKALCFEHETGMHEARAWMKRNMVAA